MQPSLDLSYRRPSVSFSRRIRRVGLWINSDLYWPSVASFLSVPPDRKVIEALKGSHATSLTEPLLPDLTWPEMDAVDWEGGGTESVFQILKDRPRLTIMTVKDYISGLEFPDREVLDRLVSFDDGDEEIHVRFN